METRIKCPHCKMSNIEYSGTVIQQRYNMVREYYCFECHRYFLWVNNIKNKNTEENK